MSEELDALREKVARALHDDSWEASLRFDNLGPKNKAYWLRIAEVACEALKPGEDITPGVGMTPLENRSPTFQQAYVCAFKDVIEWLHGRANSMNDEHARAVLNSAAFDLGRFKTDVARYMGERG